MNARCPQRLIDIDVAEAGQHRLIQEHWLDLPTATLKDLRKQAYKAGLKFVYIDGVPGDPGESTFCPNCKEKVIRRLLDPNSPRVDNLRFAPARGACANCNSRILGLWQ